MGRKVTLATSSLNQWALDFDGNLQRILKSKFCCVMFAFGLEMDDFLQRCVCIRQERYLCLGCLRAWCLEQGVDLIHFIFTP